MFPNTTVLPIAAIASLTLSFMTACVSPGEPARAADTIDSTEQATYTDFAGVGPFNGVEWQIDAPWRMEPTGLPQTYDPIPLTVTFHDVHSQPGSDPIPIDQFCGIYVLETQSNTFSLGNVAPIEPDAFHEIEASKRWLANGQLTNVPDAHIVKKIWNGDTPDAALSLNDWDEWHATALYTPTNITPGSDLHLIVLARISTGTSCATPDMLMTGGELLLQYYDGRVSHWPRDGLVESAESYFYTDALTLHYAEKPMPRFAAEGAVKWVYGDLHYHSQGTDNEGESAVNFRGVAQAMKAMGLDYLFATDHASNSQQITTMHQIFADRSPFNIPYVPASWVAAAEQYVIDYLEDNNVGLPVLMADALRDLSPERFSYLHDWLNRADGVNVEASSSGGSGRAPQIFLGAEVDAVPEISETERIAGWFDYGNGRTYNWKSSCVEIPADLVDYTNVEDICDSELIYDGSTPDQWSLRDVQGLGEMDFTRQHLLHLPYDSTDPNLFIASDSLRYGGAKYSLTQLFEELAFQHDASEGEPPKGYMFLAHPSEAASGDEFTRLGPDMVPYSDVQLMTAFQSQYILGLQAWNTDTRFSSTDGSGKFPMLYNQGIPDFEIPTLIDVTFDWSWDHQDESHLLAELGDTTAMWDRVLLWGIHPDKTADIDWLPAGSPRKMFVAGGSDAHGDLNYRRVGRMFGWGGANDTAIGKPRNLTYVGTDRLGAGGGVSQEQVVDGLKSGRFSVTDGPALRIAIDVDGDGLITDADVPMGGDFEIVGTTVPILVEWESTPEFGNVSNIDLYVGVHSGTRDGVVYAPANHGPVGSGTCVDSDTPITDSVGNVYCPLSDNYVRDPNGALRYAVPQVDGEGGTRLFELNVADYKRFDLDCTTTAETDPETGISIEFTSCDALNAELAERLYVRAFAETEGTGGALHRMAFSNPVWMTATGAVIPISPSVSVQHTTCSNGTNQFSVTATANDNVTLSLVKQVSIDGGAWQPLASDTFSAAGGQSVTVRVQACNNHGCSAFAIDSLAGPTCDPSPPTPPTVELQHLGCDPTSTNHYLALVTATGSIATTSFIQEFRVGSGAWSTLTGPSISASGTTQVSLRAMSCNSAGCSAYATTSMSAPCLVPPLDP